MTLAAARVDSSAKGAVVFMNIPTPLCNPRDQLTPNMICNNVDSGVILKLVLSSLPSARIQGAPPIQLSFQRSSSVRHSGSYTCIWTLKATNTALKNLVVDSIDVVSFDHIRKLGTLLRVVQRICSYNLISYPKSRMSAYCVYISLSDDKAHLC